MKENNLEALMPTHFLLIIIYKIKKKNATLKIFKQGHSLSDFFFLAIRTVIKPAYSVGESISNIQSR